MKNIKSYNFFESEKDKKWNDVLNNDPFLKKWRMGIKVDEDQSGFTGDGKYDVTTAYGEKLELEFYDNGGEYTGGGDWDFTATATDKYEIEYIVYGRGKGYSYPDDEIMWREDEAVSWFSYDFKIVEFIGDIVTKEPLVCSKIYSLAPAEIKEEIIASLQSKGISTDILKGGSLLNRFGLQDI